VHEAARVVRQHFGGATNFLVVVDGPEGSMIKLDTLQRIQSLQDFIARRPGVVGVTSLVDYVKILHRAFHDDDAAFFALPDNDRAVAQYLLMLGPEALQRVVDGESARAMLFVRSDLHGSHASEEALGEIRRFAAGAFPADFSVHTTGVTTLLNKTSDELTTGQVQSLVVALVVVFVTLSVFFLSIRLGLLALVPNLVPIVVFFGVLGWADIPLSISTAVIASIALGMGVDEAIHLLSEFHHHVRRHADQRRAVLEAMQTVGPPVVYTTVALSLGFLVPALSSFVPVRQFGYLSALNVGTSLLADLLFLPALVASVRFVTLWDVLRVKLGHAPHETIPLFHGLKASQARIAALLGRLTTVAAGEPIMRRGEASDAMYVLIDGRAHITRPARDGDVTLGELTRGDVVGEMGLVRGRTRAADVVAVEPTELLLVDQRFLDVLRRRYPRIANVVLLNLTRILSDRVQEAGDRLVAAVDTGRAPDPRPRIAGEVVS
jgi:CRP-like cAMP-binding protein/preprotein translocase subunit SecF